jgi:sulfonate transport system permease protein
MTLVALGPTAATSPPEPAPSEWDGLVELRTGQRHRRRWQVPRPLRRLSGPVALVAVWWLLSAIGVLSPRTLPPPGDVVWAAVDLTRTGELQTALWASLQRVLVGLAIGLTAGLVIAVAAGLTRRGEDVIDSSMQIMKAIPNFALVPLLIIWMGIGEAPKITLVALSTAMPIYVNTYGAIRGVDNRLIEVGRTLGLGRFGIVRHLVVPGSLPGFLIGLRISLTNAWLALIFAETINAKSGLGQLMSDARSWFRLDIMVLVIVVYAILGLLSYSVVRFLEKHLLQWRRGFEGS